MFKLFKRKKKAPDTYTTTRPKPRKLVVKVETFYSTHTFGLRTLINSWLSDGADRCIEDVRYAQAPGEFSALIFYSVWEEGEE